MRSPGPPPGTHKSVGSASEPVARPPSLVLASGSPRRAELLERLGLRFRVIAPDIEETPPPDAETAEEVVLSLAREKALKVAAGLKDGWVLAADTLGEFDGEILGKPRDADDAVEMLGRLAGNTHRVLTGMAILHVGKTEVKGKKAELNWDLQEGVSTTRVSFDPIPRATIEAYVATGEPLDKAGAYAIQGGAEPYIGRIDGSWSNVVGLPTGLTLRLLARSGYRLPPHLRLGKDGVAE
ncbi:MAG: Maf family protein [Euryarchaeota archaeon]|nr:Maf family protein [Euryarchaeota archaeon]